MARKRKPIENLVRIPGENAGPTWADGLGNGYTDVRNAFMNFLRLTFPTISLYEHDLPSSAHKATYLIPHIPDIGSFYPIGTLAPYVQMTPEQQKAVSDLYVKIGVAIRKAYAEGNRNGTALLAKLARGEVTIGDFDATAPIVKPEEEE